LDHYQIISPIGAGGMGEVYRARDTKLGRDVAFKVLPESFGEDADRVSRFQREAQLLAALNHPNIAQIYGVCESGQVRGIVMELIEGETLQERLRRGPLTVEECLHIARQIAEALEAAHERDIIHRDLKPGNVMLTAEGTATRVKVLDFGLAKSVDSRAADSTSSNSPTLVTDGATQDHVLLGTAAYMSPEQIRGRAAGEQSDIWAFGCVMYEMLTGLQAFTGETTTDLISGILRIEPDWRALPASTPARVGSIIKRCLEKDRRRRFHAVADVRIELEGGGTASDAVMPPRGRPRAAWAVAALFALTTIAALAAWLYFSPRPPLLLTSRFLLELTVSLPPQNPVVPLPSVSPDGRYIAFMAGDKTPTVWQLWVRPISGLVAQPVPGTDDINPSPFHPFWSADSRFIAFAANGKLFKVGIDGGPRQALCDIAGVSGTWSQDNVILFDNNGAIYRVPSGGGVSTAIRTPDKSKNEAAFRFPSFLPDGRHFLYVAFNTESGRTEVRVGSLDSKDDKMLFPAASAVMYSPPGYLLFLRGTTLMAQPFDARRLALTGDVIPVAEQVPSPPGGGAIGAGAFSVANNGTLVYRSVSAAPPTELTWFDRSGKKIDVAPAIGNYINPNLSPDETRVAVEKIEGSVRDIYLIDLVRGTSSRFTFDASIHQYPVFSPDGRQILFVSDRDGTIALYIKQASGVGDEKLLLKNANGVSDWSKDGKVVLYATGTPFKIWALPMTGDGKTFPVVNESFQYIRGKFSPDGRWVAYTSNETGRNEIYVQTFPPSGGKWQVSAGGGEYVYWRKDGKELIFGTADRKVFAVDVKLGNTFEAGVPRKLFDVPGAMAGVRFAITADAQRFLIPLSPPTDRRTFTTVLNWTAEIKK
jgi:serine/threonine protein kinase/Tol biopolymer transport system component